MRGLPAVVIFGLALPASAADFSDCERPIYTAQHDGKAFRIELRDTQPRAVLTGDGIKPIRFDMWMQNGTSRWFLSEVTESEKGLETEIIGLSETAEIYSAPGYSPVMLFPDLSASWRYDVRAGETNVYLPRGTWRLTGCATR